MSCAPALRLAWGLALGSLACRDGRWVIAGERGLGPGDAGAASARDAASSLRACPTTTELAAERRASEPAPAVDARHAGVWRGELRGGAAAGFPSLELWLSIASDGDGTLRFGAPEARGPLDPARAYLCASAADGVRCATPSGFVGGFDYRLSAVRSRGDLLSFELVDSEPWDDWCRLQAPEPWPDPTRSCGFAFGVGPPGLDSVGAAGCARLGADGAGAPLDCALMVALQRCQCGTDGCVARSSEASRVGLRLSDEVLHGSLWYAGDLDAAPVRLSRRERAAAPGGDPARP